MKLLPIIFALLTGIFWGTYGPTLAQARLFEKSVPCLGNPRRLGGHGLYTEARRGLDKLHKAGDLLGVRGRIAGGVGGFNSHTGNVYRWHGDAADRHAHCVWDSSFGQCGVCRFHYQSRGQSHALGRHCGHGRLHCRRRVFHPSFWAGSPSKSGGCITVPPFQDVISLAVGWSHQTIGKIRRRIPLRNCR